MADFKSNPFDSMTGNESYEKGRRYRAIIDAMSEGKDVPDVPWQDEQFRLFFRLWIASFAVAIEDQTKWRGAKELLACIGKGK